jgi:hypothetical protein
VKANISHHRHHLAAGIIATMALAIAACGGSNPEERKPEDTTTTAPASAALSMEWTDTDLETDTSRVGYGSNPKGILARKDGVLVFTPQTPRDHIASRFIQLPAYTGSRELELVLDMKSAGGDACEAVVQDQDFKTVVVAPCSAAGEQKAAAKVAPDVRTVRLYFPSPKQAPMPLPARVRLVEHR